MPQPPDIPDKTYFRIGEVSRLVGVDTHVLRYWEAEFAIIRPFRGKSKQRLYRRQDVENFLRVRQLLHVEGYTIAGAKKALLTASCRQAQQGASNMQAPGGTAGQHPKHCADSGREDLIEDIRLELTALYQLLTRKRGI
ncbi:MAG: MerR family transcriptional regulator [Desulfobulbus sp.]|jgi:DNA-binding transcriptional MerR regulator